jgi:hypothetical protein
VVLRYSHLGSLVLDTLTLAEWRRRQQMISSSKSGPIFGDLSIWRDSLGQPTDTLPVWSDSVSQPADPQPKKKRRRKQ